MATKGDFNGTVTVRPLAYWIGWSRPQFQKIVDNRYLIVEPRRLGKRLVTLVFWRDFFFTLYTYVLWPIENYDREVMITASNRSTE